MAAIIVEDGSGVPNANSYVDAAQITEFLETFGVVPTATIESLAITSAMFLSISASCWPGCRATDVQGMDWPRKDAYIGSCSYTPFPSDQIPSQIKQAQLFAALAAAQGINLFPSFDPTAEGSVKREEIGPLKTEYFGSNSAEMYGSMPTLPAVTKLLAEVTGNGCGAGLLRTIRV